jgi:hypothetical protein
MAFGASHLGVLALQGVVCGGVFGHAKFRLLESIDRMAGVASSTILARSKLALMIVLVTIHTLGVRQRGVEAQAVMARGATHAGMFSLKGVTGFRVVETGCERCALNFLPCGR